MQDRKKQGGATSLSTRGRSTGRQEIKSEIAALLSERSLKGWLYFSEDMCGDHGAVVEEFYWIFTFESSNNPYLRVARLLKLCPDQHLFSDETFSQLEDPAGKQKSLNSVRPLLLKA